MFTYSAICLFKNWPINHSIKSRELHIDMLWTLTNMAFPVKVEYNEGYSCLFDLHKGRTL